MPETFLFDHAITVLGVALHNAEQAIITHQREGDEPESYEICREKARDYESAIALIEGATNVKGTETE